LVVLLFLLFFLFGDVRGKFSELSEGVKSFRNTFSSQSSVHKDHGSNQEVSLENKQKESHEGTGEMGKSQNTKSLFNFVIHYVITL